MAKTILGRVKGLSAYEVWLAQGNSGTMEDYLAAIKGDKGDKGEPGDVSTAQMNQAIEDALGPVASQLAEIAPSIDFDTMNAAAIKIRKKQSPSTLSFALMSDTHYDSDGGIYDPAKLETAAKMGMITNYVKTDFIGNLGDLVPGNKSKDATLIDLMKLFVATNQNSRVPVLYARGNHDNNEWYSSGGYGGTYLPSDIINDEEWYQQIFGVSAASLVTDSSNPDGGYGYLDHEGSKIRVFLLNTEDIPYIDDGDGTYRYTSRGAFSDAQLNFIADSLYFTGKENPNEWAALFLSHRPLDTSSANGYTFGIHDALIRGIEVFFGILNAYKNGSSFAFTGSVYNSSLGDISADFNVSVSVDYSTKGFGDVIGFISGHTHSDNFSNAVGLPGGLSYGYSYLGLVGATAFANFVIDRANNKISVIKYGASIPETLAGTVVGTPNEGTIASGDWSVTYSQFRPEGANLFNGFDSFGAGYKLASSAFSLDTMEVVSRTADANYIITKVIPVRPFTKYAIPSEFSGQADAFGASGARSGALAISAGAGYKWFMTGIRQCYVAFSFHMPTYTDYANFKIKEIYSGLTF